jgi:hypothetical protein
LNNGVFNAATGMCDCPTGYAGFACQLGKQMLHVFIQLWFKVTYSNTYVTEEGSISCFVWDSTDVPKSIPDDNPSNPAISRISVV